MNNRNVRSGAGVLLAAGVILIAGANGGCSAASTLAQAAQGCDEFSGGANSVASLSIDGDTKAFLTASANLVTVAQGLEKGVLDACIAIDKDLGVTDTWTAMAPTDGSAPDAELTEACKQASTKINAVLMPGERQRPVYPVHLERTLRGRRLGAGVLRGFVLRDGNLHASGHHRGV